MSRRSCFHSVIALVVGQVGVGAAAAQDLFVSSIFSDRVIRYNGTSGALIGTFVAGIDGPYGLDFGPDGHLSVGNLFPPKAIRKFDGVSGASLGVVVNMGATDPIDIRYGPGGNLYIVAGGASGSVLRYNGSSLTPFAGPITEPVGMTFGPNGDLFVGSFTQNQVLRFNGTTGASLGVFASNGLSSPYGMRFGPDGNLYVANVGADVITRYDGASGALLGTFASGGGLNDPTGLVFGPDGNLYVSSGEGDQVLRYSGVDGSFLGVFASGGGLDGPVFLTFQPVPKPGALVLSAIPLAAWIRRRCRNSK